MTSCTKDSLDPTLYSFVGGDTEIKWTAYKCTNKIGVSGLFEDFKISGPKYQTSIREMLSNVKIDIKTESLNTRSTFRDENILKYFFTTLDNHEWIRGSVVKVSGNDMKGKLFVMMDFNNVSNEIVFDFKINTGMLVMEADFDLIDWNAAHSLDNFDDCCSTLHTGEDGKQMIWPNLHLEISSAMEIAN